MADLVTEILSLPEKITEIELAITHLITSVEKGVADVKGFKFDPQWKTRVIWVPSAIDQTKEFIIEVVDDVKARYQKFKDLTDLFKAQVKALESGASGYAGRPISGLGKAGLDILIASLVISLFGDLARTFERVSDFADLFDKIIAKLERLDPVFMPQSSTREKKTITYFKRV